MAPGEKPLDDLLEALVLAARIGFHRLATQDAVLHREQGDVRLGATDISSQDHRASIPILTRFAPAGDPS